MYRDGLTRPCAACGAVVPTDTLFHSGDGLVCEPCHKSARAADKLRHASSEGGMDAMLNGSLGLVAGLATAVWTIFVPDGPVPLRPFAIGVSVAGVALVRAFRLRPITPRVSRWRIPAGIGGAFAVVATVVLLTRLE